MLIFCICYLGVIHLVRPQNFPKNYHFLNADMHTYVCVCARTCVYQGVRNVSLSENVTHVLNKWPRTNVSKIGGNTK